ncbi:hypothetical protein STEG23_019248 [Scotinomys teguina]
MQPGCTTNTGSGAMEVVVAAPRCQLLLIVLMAAMLLQGMKGSLLLVQRTIMRTMELQKSIGKGFLKDVFISRKQEVVNYDVKDARKNAIYDRLGFPGSPSLDCDCASLATSTLTPTAVVSPGPLLPLYHTLNLCYMQAVIVAQNLPM